MLICPAICKDSIWSPVIKFRHCCGCHGGRSSKSTYDKGLTMVTATVTVPAKGFGIPIQAALESKTSKYRSTPPGTDRGNYYRLRDVIRCYICEAKR